MVQQVKRPAARPDNLSLILRGYVVDGKNEILKLFSTLGMCTVAYISHMYACTHIAHVCMHTHMRAHTFTYNNMIFL